MYKYIIYTQCILPLKYIHNYKFLLDMLFKCHLKIKINVQCDSNKIKQWSPSHLQIVLTVSYRIFSVSLSVFCLLYSQITVGLTILRTKSKIWYPILT